MEYFYITDPGKIRERNEDSVVVVKNKSDEFLLIVADGMGGHSGGEIASSIATSHLSKHFKELPLVGTKEQAMKWLKEIVSEANASIYKNTLISTENSGMGTTLVCAILTEDYLLIGNIGDSSGYVIKNSKLHKITFDHTLVNLLVKSGEISVEEAKDHPRKNVLMRALGSASSVEMDIFDVESNVEGILLCSDGLTNMLSDDQIEKVLNEELSVEEKVKKLVYKCNNRGGNDNISIAYIKEVGARNDK
jgi:PPM family protein phosphatase